MVDLEDIQRKHIIAYFLGTTMLIGFLSPLYSGLMTSFKTQTGFLETLPLAPPGEYFTLETWAIAWDVLAGPMVNSLIMTVPATVFSAVLGSLAAYGMTMINWRGQVGLFVVFLLAIFLPKQSIVVPLAQFWRMVGLEAILTATGLPITGRHVTLTELIITHTAFGIGISTVLFRGYYITLNQDIIEAARVDGASIYAIYRNIVLPLSYPMFMVVFIYQFTQIYNEFFYALILVGGSQAEIGAPVTLALQELNSGREALVNVEMAGAFIVALPTIIVYIVFGEEFAKGVKY